LSSAQKRALLGQAVAAVITTALMAAPFVTPPSGSADVSPETTLPAQSFARVVAAVAVERASASVALPKSGTAARTRPRPEPRLMAAAVPAIALQPVAVGTSGYSRGAAAVTERAGSRKGLSTRVAGWLVGDGSVTVRPFPTVSMRQ
jgi:hypothetical protein